MKKHSSSTGGWGGRRKGAGRPLGSRNRLRLVHVPSTNHPMEWLENAMRHEGIPLRMRLGYAKALLPYRR